MSLALQIAPSERRKERGREGEKERREGGRKRKERKSKRKRYLVQIPGRSVVVTSRC